MGKIPSFIVLSWGVSVFFAAGLYLMGSSSLPRSGKPADPEDKCVITGL